MITPTAAVIILAVLCALLFAWCMTQREEIARLRIVIIAGEAKRDEEIHALAWNLAGCATIADSRTPATFDESMARPALRAVNKLAQAHVAALQRLEACPKCGLNDFKWDQTEGDPETGRGAVGLKICKACGLGLPDGVANPSVLMAESYERKLKAYDQTFEATALERDQAIQQRDRLASDALTALAGLGIPTPERGFVAEPGELAPCIKALGRRHGADHVEWLLDIGKVIGCNHVDERLPHCVREVIDGLKLSNGRFRRLLAFNYAGAALYHDDGELQDNRSTPHIDFLRDPIDELERKMQQRGVAKLGESAPAVTAEASREAQTAHALDEYLDLDHPQT